ncbi:MAG TPA: hypothetical protein VLI72_05700 [Methylibium sp.]|nr:hypothetical protein [Methylibium sp.]
MSLALDKTQVTNSGIEAVVATATATNASNQVVQGAAVTLSVDNSGATIAVGGATTDAAGELDGTVRIGPNHANRTITVTATAAGVAPVTATFEVTGSNLVGTPVPAVLSSGAGGVVRYRLVDATSNPMAGYAITVDGPTAASGTTNANGEFDYSYTAPTAAGTLTITASAAGDDESVDVTVQSAGSGSIPDAVGPVASPSLSANPDVVAVSTGTTSGQAQLRALFLGSNNQPIRNVRVRFDLNGDLNSVGGTIGTGTSLVYSNAEGIALSTYTAGARSSPTNGVTIRACWALVDFAVGTCPNPTPLTTTLTVASEPVSIAIGTDNTIGEGDSGLSYVKRYVIQVADSSGVAKSGVQVTASIDLEQFMKGQLTPGEPWVKVYAGGGGATDNVSRCPNEDTNRNNALDAGEDADGDGQLEPRKADVVVSYPGGNTTNTDGTVIVQIKYPKNVASWVNFDLKVSAGVSASEGVAHWRGTLPFAAADVEDVTVSPPFQFSPYGQQAGCTVH